ncbi:MAG: hypothetical protein AAGD25_10330 [Cyanobacteria bacterium P01_F01_bin.150]
MASSASSDNPTRARSVSSIERLKLIQTLNKLPEGQFEELLVALNPPGGIVPKTSAAQGNRTSALLQWVESPAGRGLAELQELLSLLLNDPH